MAGSKSCDSDVTMMTKRSSHIPMLTKIEMTNRAARFVRTRLKKSSSGTTTLHVSMPQEKRRYSPNIRL